MARSYNSVAAVADGILRFRHARGRAGPHVTLVGGVHGNERIGVDVLDALRRAMFHVDPWPARGWPTITNGSVTLAYGNPAAIRVGKRGSASHQDLNRCFTTKLLQQQDRESLLYEERRARALAANTGASDVMIDVHSTNKPSLPFLRVAGHPQGVPPHVQRFCRWLPGDILLHDPHYLLADGRVALTDEYVGANGGIGICYESGLATDYTPATVEQLGNALWDILEHELNVVEFRRPTAADPATMGAAPPVGQRRVYEIKQVLKLTADGFEWADGVGNANFELVPAGRPIGYVQGQAVTVNYHAYLVFPKVKSLWKVGSYVNLQLSGLSMLSLRPLVWLAQCVQ
ncbi:TPA: hypothetical protein N0F65_007014 [Lagenidium giganteum]|uniref:Succinylglutamate desuccinylase/Aspartoacylase catalytic domain-containing protein n=1 Tax=Lagenidium giganteum TaxID=4803 RepID=A0AAV2ZJG5_9STRA|nr:TPA: hypothetical protein N0F65_007014 [Lagenidium giganteum]